MTILFLIPAIILWYHAGTISADNLMWSSILLFVLAAGCLAYEVTAFSKWLIARRARSHAKHHQQDWQARWESEMDRIAKIQAMRDTY